MARGMEMRLVCLARLVYIRNPAVRYNNSPDLYRTINLRVKSHRAMQRRLWQGVT
jgi:hypothetical protein